MPNLILYPKPFIVMHPNPFTTLFIVMHHLPHVPTASDKVTLNIYVLEVSDKSLTVVLTSVTFMTLMPIRGSKR